MAGVPALDIADHDHPVAEMAEADHPPLAVITPAVFLDYYGACEHVGSSFEIKSSFGESPVALSPDRR